MRRVIIAKARGGPRLPRAPCSDLIYHHGGAGLIRSIKHRLPLMPAPRSLPPGKDCDAPDLASAGGSRDNPSRHPLRLQPIVQGFRCLRRASFRDTSNARRRMARPIAALQAMRFVAPKVSRRASVSTRNRSIASTGREVASAIAYLSRVATCH